MRSLRRVFALLPLAAAPARADCNLPSPEVIRSVVPVDGAAAVPTSVRVRVTYQTGATAQMMCGAAPGPPEIRLAQLTDGGVGDGGAADGGAADGGGAPDGGVDDGGVASDGGVDDGGASDGGGNPGDVPGQWIQATDIDPRVGIIWQFLPSSPLAPNTAYELYDGYPAICPCDTGPCVPGPSAVFARFTTGSGADQGRPTFSGLVGTSCAHIVCPVGATTCCGPFDHHDYTFVPANDAADPEGNLVGVHLYVRRDTGQYDFTHPLSPLTISDPVDSPYAYEWALPLPPGKFVAIAHAFDSSGNEDANSVEVTFQFPLANEPLCADVPEDGGMDLDDAGPTPDFAPPVDMAGGGVDMGCGCRIGGSTRPRALAVGLLLVGLALVSRRARRPRRRGGAAGRP